MNTTLPPGLCHINTNRFTPMKKKRYKNCITMFYMHISQTTHVPHMQFQLQCVTEAIPSLKHDNQNVQKGKTDLSYVYSSCK